MRNTIITLSVLAVFALAVIPEDAEARRGGGRSRGSSYSHSSGASKHSTNISFKVGGGSAASKSQQRDNIPPPPDGKYDPAPTVFTADTCASLNLMAQTKEVRAKCKKLGIFL